MRKKNNASTYLSMVFVVNVNPVYFDDAITFTQSSWLSGTVVIYFSNELTSFPFLSVQIESVTFKVGPFHEMTVSRSGSIFRRDTLLLRFWWLLMTHRRVSGRYWSFWHSSPSSSVWADSANTLFLFCLLRFALEAFANAFLMTHVVNVAEM